MYDQHRELIEALKSTSETLNGLLSQVPVEQARSARGGDENWSVVEVICHLRDAEEISLQRVQAMRDQAHPRISSYDQEALARERNYREADPYAALEAFTGFRERHAAVLSALSAEEWERCAEFEAFGQITISAHTIHKLYHDAVHCAQIARQLLAVKATE
ncbi:MAG TPA: DinB family protein [Anaerolineales bacterium]|nr:DinB family protein [Anaerolineales bacterium]